MDVTNLRIDKVSYRIGAQQILSDIDAEVPTGSFTGLLGPNGAGKSTLMRLMAGLSKPDAGRVLLNESDVHRIPERERARTLALVSQNPSVGFGFTVADVVAMGRYAYTGRFAPLTAACRSAIARAMSLTGVTQFASRRTTELSGGELQRVYLARALAQEPKLLLLDEPTSNLDVKYQIELLEIVSELQRDNGLTVIMAIHDLTWALRYCTHALLLHNGRLAAAGPVSSVLTEERIAQVFGVRMHRMAGPEGEPLFAPSGTIA